MTKALSGGCLCGAVRYAVQGELRQAVACHCEMCLRTHGHFAAYSAAPRAALSLTESRGLAWYASSDKARRGFCRECGASLFWEPRDADYVAIAAGTLDRPSGLRLVRHIYVDEKPDYYEIDDGLEQLPGGMGD